MKRLSDYTACLAIAGLAATPLAAEIAVPQERELVAKLCGGGEVRIPIRPSDDRHEDQCPDMNACHAATCRKQFDPGQRPQRD